jgi:hypothetical protein
MSIQQNFPAISPSLNLNFARSKTLDPRITFARPSTSGDATYMDANGLIVTAAADEPRFDHKYENGVIKSLGLLVEEQRSNIRQYSDIDGSIGTDPTSAVIPYKADGQSMLVSNDVFIGPNGQSAKHTKGSQGDSNIGYYSLVHSSDDLNKVHTASLYVYIPSSQSSGFTTNTVLISPEGTGITNRDYTHAYANPNITDKWQRIYVSYTPTVATSVGHVFRVNTSAGRYVYTDAWQVEQGSFPTSYIPTSGSTATRSPDSVTMTGDNFSDWYNQEQGSFLWIGNVYSREISPVQPFRVNQGANLRGLGIQFDTRSANNTTSFASRTQSSNIPVKTAPSGIIPSDNKIKIAGGYIESFELSTIRAAFNGLPEDSSGGGSQTDITYDTMYEIEIMGNRGISGTNNQFTGVCEQLVYYPRILTDAQLQNLTK